MNRRMQFGRRAVAFGILLSSLSVTERAPASPKRPVVIVVGGNPDGHYPGRDAKARGPAKDFAGVAQRVGEQRHLPRALRRRALKVIRQAQHQGMELRATTDGVGDHVYRFIAPDAKRPSFAIALEWPNLNSATPNVHVYEFDRNANTTGNKVHSLIRARDYILEEELTAAGIGEGNGIETIRVERDRANSTRRAITYAVDQRGRRFLRRMVEQDTDPGQAGKAAFLPIQPQR